MIDRLVDAGAPVESCCRILGITRQNYYKGKLGRVIALRPREARAVPVVHPHQPRMSCKVASIVLFHAAFHSRCERGAMEIAQPAFPGGFAVTVSDKGGAHSAKIVCLHGELDVASVVTLRTTLEEVLINGREKFIVVDLTDLRFIDSSGLGALVGAHKKARVLKTTLKVVCIEGMVRRVIEMTGLDHVLVISGSVEEALR